MNIRTLASRRRFAWGFSLFFSFLFIAVPAIWAQSGSMRRAHLYAPHAPPKKNLHSKTQAAHRRSDYSRIVSLAPVITETLFALGVGQKIVGVTRFCDRPVEAKRITKVGGFIDPQLEKILYLKPDLVIAMPSMGQRSILDHLRAQEIDVIVAFGDTINEIYDLVSYLGDAVGEEKRAKSLLSRIQKDLDRIKERSNDIPQKPRVLVLVSIQPLVAAGSGTFAQEAIPIAGGVNALVNTRAAWPTLSLESVLSLAPDVLIAAEGPASATALRQQFTRRQNESIKVMAAHESHQKSLFMRPGPYLAEDIEALSQLLHPKGPAEKGRHP